MFIKKNVELYIRFKYRIKFKCNLNLHIINNYASNPCML